MDKIAIFAMYAIGGNIGWALMGRFLEWRERRKQERGIVVPYRWKD